MSDPTRPVIEHAERCRIEGCDKLRKRGRAVCSMHAARIWRHGDPDAVQWEKRSVRGVCLVEGCGQLDHGPHGYCDKHRTRIRRHGDPLVLLVAEYKRMPNGNITYGAAHARVRAESGPAWKHLCCHCMQFAEEWAYDHNDPAELVSPEGSKYSTDPRHYIPLCRSCHRRFDSDINPRPRDDRGRFLPAPPYTDTTEKENIR